MGKNRTSRMALNPVECEQRCAPSLAMRKPCRSAKSLRRKATGRIHSPKSREGDEAGERRLIFFVRIFHKQCEQLFPTQIIEHAERSISGCVSIVSQILKKTQEKTTFAIQPRRVRLKQSLKCFTSSSFRAENPTASCQDLRQKTGELIGGRLSRLI